MIKKQNQRLERELTEVAEKHEAEMNLLRGQYDRLKNSIQFIQTQNRDPLGQFWPPRDHFVAKMNVDLMKTSVPDDLKKLTSWFSYQILDRISSKL